MFQRDYIMRMIEQLGQVAGAVLGLKKEWRHAEALQAIEELLEKQFRLNSRLLRSLSDEDLVAMLSRSGNPDHAQLQVLAVLLREEADLLLELGQESAAFVLRIKSLHLFMRLSLMGAERIAADPDEEAERQLEALASYELPPDTKRLAARWMEQRGSYALAEDLMFELEEDGELAPGENEAFYRRLLLQDDERLAAGGVTRLELLTVLKEDRIG
ncbi:MULTISPECIES: DUF6483 family protein [Paenibacillus]|uniref:DUF6483 family protein n=1 Tax=Paenibacillus TaxID=44249 RepID=UPI0003F8CFEE|nr:MULTISPECIES: DUF6483 family protein [Paenibacillus]KKC47567.1 hypothetical protein VE23_11140 [Paenibacillus sp. D9]